MVERVVKLEKNTDTLQQDMTGLKTDVAVLQTDMTGLKKDVGALQTDMTSLKKDVAVLQTDVAGLKKDVGVLQANVTELRTDMAELKSDVAVIKSNYTTKADLLNLENKFDIKFEGLRTELHRSLAMQTKWVVASQVGVLGLGLGLAKLLF
ncbi:coiled-coil domain-containing protein [Pantoea coffeiphila]|uniref:DUF1640 domain-containing protein n=1 Tax=Pantoea coffeiphila TaxID=1465635 RepID=A0A2S9IHX8_9GAMM|nr:coiled-coil domain-containing protein [Pantoea coffeiphila]PRD17379.1 hypothetical protein CQW29_01725 [Pantoea coffeiphila]